MPHFVTQRNLYEARERLSKTYDWNFFMLAQIIVELPWNSLMAVIMFACWYCPAGLQRNAIGAGQQTERGALMFPLLLEFMVFTSTFTDMIIAGFNTADPGGVREGDLEIDRSMKVFSSNILRILSVSTETQSLKGAFEQKRGEGAALIRSSPV
ncbi:uncharacterized protein Z519_04957 [Cladophialophora bantiana CBS 173.52]|uniref:ABC-2 type transporter transmembrane domain-containing protein n=1 Tax=Cladophialophora bantiana (strain ATCC 10958 / CBS 173.52 / CDC B-1940 / NIH 8579) TaxID=1442370 RepID=A0A0D2G8R7_CLAB1|nr:uncharacterized protein Z519_04957 [Cladophialophora bantiana CBS 173.52]KIW94977.1 hypothetical protein Z519_04957 [Cladophialophora bantiana CBS 173.52]